MLVASSSGSCNSLFCIIMTLTVSQLLAALHFEGGLVIAQVSYHIAPRLFAAGRLRTGSWLASACAVVVVVVVSRAAGVSFLWSGFCNRHPQLLGVIMLLP
jgi:hypothetical protein